MGIIPNHEYFNFLNFRYFSVNHDLDYQFEAFWLPKDKEAESAQKDRLLMVDYLVTKTGDQGPSFVHNPELTPLLLKGELPFIEIARFKLPDGSDAIVYRRKE